MTPTITLTQKLVDRLPKGQVSHLGYIYGIVTKNNITILELQLEVDDNLLTDLFPAEIFLCGIINIGADSYNEQLIKSKLNDVYVTDNPVFINYTPETQQIKASLLLNGKFQETKISIINEPQFLSQFLYLQLQANISLTSDLNSNGIHECLANLRKEIAAGCMTFNIINTNIYLMQEEGDNTVIGVAADSLIGDLADDSNELSEGTGRKKKQQQYSVDVIKINALKNVTQIFAGNGKEHAPLCVLDKKHCRTINLPVPINALAVVSRQLKLQNLYGIIIESAVRNLRLLESTILNHLQSSNNTISQPEVFHFYPETCGHFFTQIYLKEDTEELLLPKRKQLHQKLLLSEDDPIFRRSNQFNFTSKSSINEPLINPHLGIKPTDNGGKIALVKGKYSYYHYCQNKMDDNGWGCAYRSLQTLASWFLLQGYSDVKVPTFKDIQKCLVDIGDKPSKFIDSRQWIGSTEVNFVLNTLLGVTSKILYVSSGEEMGSKGPELVNHFENHGSPIMIGGGVLAHTILGVDYNSDTGNIKFLILDPHYTGGEDLHVIQNKGWCGWKNVDFWDKTAYYNMCLPQVPKCI